MCCDNVLVDELKEIRDDLDDKLDDLGDRERVKYDLNEKEFVDVSDSDWEEMLYYEPYEIDELNPVRNFINFLLKEDD